MAKSIQSKKIAPSHTPRRSAKSVSTSGAAAPSVPEAIASAAKTSVPIRRQRPVAAKSPAARTAPAKKTAASAPASAPATKKGVAKKVKLVHEKFTMPAAEYQVLKDIKKACNDAGMVCKKSQLLRVAVSLLTSLNQEALLQAIASLAPLKAVRPAKGA